MNKTEIIISVIGLIGTLLPSYWGYLEKKSNRKKDELIRDLQQQLKTSKENTQEAELRSAVVERLLDITLLSDIRSAVDIMFEETKAERFLILIAINGNTDFNMVSVIFEQHKNNQSINAIARYRNLSIDSDYKKMLLDVERHGTISLDVSKMSEDSLLYNIYNHEGIKHSEIKFLTRESIDGDNDVLIFSSVATFKDEPFTSKEKVLFLTQYDSTIIPALKTMIAKESLI